LEAIFDFGCICSNDAHPVIDIVSKTNEKDTLGNEALMRQQLFASGPCLLEIHGYAAVA